MYILKYMYMYIKIYIYWNIKIRRNEFHHSLSDINNDANFIMFKRQLAHLLDDGWTINKVLNECIIHPIYWNYINKL